nr:hypothetical protein [uncultured Actinoplanes sp.]
MLDPSVPITALLTAAARQQTDPARLQAVMARQTEFASPLQAQLAGIAFDPRARDLAELLLDDLWSDAARQQDALTDSGPEREVIIGSGFHAAVYAAVRVLTGHRRPWFWNVSSGLAARSP